MELSNVIKRNAGHLEVELIRLLNEEGELYVPGDWYAESRYYSEIPGVKNIRVRELPVYEDNDKYHLFVEVKVLSPLGYLMPERVAVNGIEYELRFTRSARFNGRIYDLQD